MKKIFFDHMSENINISRKCSENVRKYQYSRIIDWKNCFWGKNINISMKRRFLRSLYGLIEKIVENNVFMRSCWRRLFYTYLSKYYLSHFEINRFLSISAKYKHFDQIDVFLRLPWYNCFCPYVRKYQDFKKKCVSLI